MSQFVQRFEHAYVEQKRADINWERRQKECLDWERELMKGDPSWVVGKRRYATQHEDKPDKDLLDQRRLGPW